MDEKTILIDALAIASLEDRADFLSRECSDDPALRRRIDALIEANQQTEQMLDSPLFEAGQTDHGVEIDLSFLEACDRPDTLGRIGTYEVVDVLGRGATGIVLKAHDPKLNRFVAVKVLIPQIATNATARKRFLREARATAAVSHPHVITIHAVEEHHQIPYLVMECIVGKTLQEKIDNEGTLEIEAVLRIGIQIAEGLAAAHAQGLIHRDIKPANILLENGVGRVSITDFGLARAADDATLTKSGCVSGTPPYMSPEQTQAQPLDSRSDLFSLGSVMYAMCTGHSPFRADSTIGAIRRVCDETPRPVYELNPKVPGWLADIIDKLLAKNRDDRFQSATEVADLLGQRLRSFQDPTQFDQPETLDSPTKQPHAATRKTSSSSRRVLVTVMFALVVGLGIAEITGVTRLREVLLGPAVVEHSKPIAGSPVVNPDEPPSKNNPLAKVVSPPEPTPTEILTSDK